MKELRCRKEITSSGKNANHSRRSPVVLSTHTHLDHVGKLLLILQQKNAGVQAQELESTPVGSRLGARGALLLLNLVLV